jgi:tetratricopeptide (TPR) repeat protein
MAGKITTILIQKEAELYCRQGLHKEALKLYRKLLSSAPNIDPALQKSVKNKISQVCETLESKAPLELRQLSKSDVVCIKQGWGKRGSEIDVLVCAQAFFRMGRFQEALDELTELLKKGRTTKKVIILSTQCLVKLHQPSDIVSHIEVLGKKIFDSSHKRLRFYVQLLEAMLTLKKPGYAQPLLGHLQNHPALGEATSRQLMAAAVRMIQQYPPKENMDEVKNDSPFKEILAPRQETVILQSNESPLEKPRNRSLLQRVLHLFNRT